MSKSAKIALFSLAGLIVALLLLAGGFFFGMSPEFGGRLQQILPSGCSSSTGSVDEQLQEEVLLKLESSFYKEVDPATLERGAIDGMVASLNDRWTVYLDPEEYASLKQGLSQSYSGVGMTMELIDGLVTIVSTFEGSPAALAGVRKGDILVTIDDASTDGMKIDEVAAKVRGPENTTVKIGFYRPVASTTTTTEAESPPDTDDTTVTTAGVADSSHLPPGGTALEFTLTRKTISMPVTATEMLQDGDKKVAHIGFAIFSEKSAEALRAEVKKAIEVEKADVIILDLRGNGGGIVTEAVDVASIFIESGTIVSTEGLHSPEESKSATGGAYTQIPVYVLVDGGTASASEIVSGALQDYKRATLVGETTYGKGLVQSIEPLSNGGAIKVTSAVYLTPLGRDINQKGIEPDVVAPDDPATLDVDETLQKTLDLILGGAAFEMSRPGASGFRPRFFVQRTAAGAASAGAPSGDDLIGAELALGPQDSRHARTVLRLQLGDACEVVVAAEAGATTDGGVVLPATGDGAAPLAAVGAAPGGAATGAAGPGAAVYAATVSAVGDPVKVRVEARLEDDLAGATYRVQVGLVQALARPAVMDYIFEKGTEVGASFFVLVSAEGSPKWATASAGDRLDRWNRIVREAAKQSKHVSVPTVVFAGSVERGLDHVAAAKAWSLVLQPGASASLESVLSDPAVRQSATGPVALWIGAEGGWTAGETAQFELAASTPVRLGRSVLRTETAGPVAVAVTRLLLGDW